MNGLLLLCSIAILATVYAIPPGLSESFYLQATGTETTISSGTTTYFTRYNYAIDTTRMLGFEDVAATTNGVQGSLFDFLSVKDNLTYTNSNGTCKTMPGSGNFSQTIIFLFGAFTTGVEAPPGTITYISTSSGSTSVLVTVNGLPTTLTSTSTSSTFNLDIHSYTNSAPPFSVFVLPDACSDFTCDSCYSPTTTPSSAVSVTSSFLLMLAALAMFLFSTV